jgi:hypothetical protein
MSWPARPQVSISISLPVQPVGRLVGVDVAAAGALGHASERAGQGRTGLPAVAHGGLLLDVEVRVGLTGGAQRGDGHGPRFLVEAVSRSENALGRSLNVRVIQDQPEMPEIPDVIPAPPNFSGLKTKIK